MDDIKNVFSKLTKSITKTSSNFVQTTKYSVNLAKEEDLLNSLYIELGKKVHEIYAYGGSLGTFFDDKYVELLEQERKIEELKNQLDVLKGARDCPHCGQVMSSSATFCPKCGKNANEFVKQEDNKEAVINTIENISEEDKTNMEIKNDETEFVNSEIESEIIKSEKKICYTCGRENDFNDRFCLTCGRKM